MTRQDQTVSTFTLRIASGGGTSRCTATNDFGGGTANGGGTAAADFSHGGGTATADPAAAFRTTRLATQFSLSSARISADTKSGGGTAYFRRAA